MPTLDQTTFNQISTIDVTPPLSSNNYRVNEHDETRHQYIMTTAQAISRFVNGLFLVQQSFKQSMHLPETPGLMHMAIQQNLLEPLSQQYEEFKDFQFEITSSGSIIGKNDVANNILYAICQVAKAPVHDDTTDGINQHGLLRSYTDDLYDFDEEYDDDEMEDDGEDEDEDEDNLVETIDDDEFDD